MNATRFSAYLCVSLSVCLSAPADRADAQASELSQAVTMVRTRARVLRTVEADANDRDLKAFDDVVHGARVVGLGESVHDMRQFLQMRDRVARYLVSRHDFRALIMETGMPEAEALNAWIVGDTKASPEFPAALNYGLGEDAEVRVMLQWLHDYNAQLPKSRRVQVFGMDLPGSGAVIRPALEPVWRYLHVVDAEFERDSRARLADVLERFGSGGVFDAKARYDALDPAARATLQAGIRALKERLLQERARFLRQTPQASYDWVVQMAQVAMQTEHVLRIGPTAPENPRDSAMAENVQWVLAHTGSGSRVIVLAHNAHVQKESIHGPALGTSQSYRSTGQLLARVLGGAYRCIGTAYGTRTDAAHAMPSDSGTVDDVLTRAERPLFVLNMRSAAGRNPGGAWLDAEQPMRFERGQLLLRPREAFDAIVFIGSIEPARRM